MRDLFMGFSKIFPLVLRFVLHFFQNCKNLLVRLERSLKVHVPALNLSKDIERFYLPERTLRYLQKQLCESVCCVRKVTSLHEEPGF
jgi:hypothetical protein